MPSSTKRKSDPTVESMVALRLYLASVAQVRIRDLMVPKTALERQPGLTFQPSKGGKLGMTMPSSASNTVNGQGFKRQEETFDEFWDNSVHQNGTNGKVSEQPVLEPKERLLGLTKQQQRVVKAVCRLPGSEAVAIGNAVNLGRHAALAYLNKLADEKGVLDSDKHRESRGGARKSIHFWLAEDIPAALVNAILGDSDADPDAILAAHKRRTKEEPTTEPKKDADLTPMAIFASLPPLVKDVAVAIGQAGDKGISVIALSQVTEQKINRIYDRVGLIVDSGLATKQLVAGFRKQSVYVPISALKEIVEQLFPKQADQTDSASNSDVNENDEEPSTMPPKQSSSANSSQTSSHQPIEEKEINRVWEVLTVVAKKLKNLENRFARVEASLQGKEHVRADEILAMLNDDL